MKNTTSLAHSNIALIKYWGKANHKLNIPGADSISITLKQLRTKTSIELSEKDEEFVFYLDSKRANEKQTQKVIQFFHLIREKNKTFPNIRITSENNFPTAAGLASSASGFAALALAATHFSGLNFTPSELSLLARQGSGSAARSIFGGFVHMHRGKDKNGKDAFAEQLYDEHYWDLRLLILVTSTKEKEISSTEGMNLTATTSPYYNRWIQSTFDDIGEMKNAITKKDFEKVGELTEFSCLKMHGLAMSANPGIIYWNENTIKLINKVRNLRKEGLAAFFTIDAGPQVKVLCLPSDVKKIQRAFENESGIQKIIHTEIGPSAHIIEENN